MRPSIKGSCCRLGGECEEDSVGAVVPPRLIVVGETDFFGKPDFDGERFKICLGGSREVETDADCEIRAASQAIRCMNDVEFASGHGDGLVTLFGGQDRESEQLCQCWERGWRVAAEGLVVNDVHGPSCRVALWREGGR